MLLASTRAKPLLQLFEKSSTCKSCRMKAHYHFLLLLSSLLSCAVHGSAQTLPLPSSSTPSLPPAHATGKHADPESETNFMRHLDSLLAMPNDTSFALDTAATYRITYLTSCPFNHTFCHACYLDQNYMVCIKNLRTSKDIMRLNHIDPKMYSTGITTFQSRNEVEFTCFSHLPKNTLDDPYSTHAFNILSFGRGQHLIIHHRISGPDIRGSMPPGVDNTYFLERVKQDR